MRVSNVTPKPVLLPRTGKSVGIDLGVTKFAHDSDNHIIENPKYMQQSLAKLKTLQRSVSRKKKGISNRKKAKAKSDQVTRAYCQSTERSFAQSFNILCKEL